MFECRNPKKPDCKGHYRSIMDTLNHARCDRCGHIININNLKEEQIDHDIKENKKNN